MWDFRWNRFEVSSIYVQSWYWQIAPLQECLTLESINDVQYKHCARIEFLVAENSQWQMSTNVFAMFMEVLCSTEALLAAEWREWQLLKKGKQISMICLADIFAQLLVLKCRSMLMPSFLRIDASHVNKLHSVFQSTKEVLVT